MYYVYYIQNLINFKVYIGQTDNFRRRWNEHRYDSTYKEYPLYRAMRKYGKDNFDINIIEELETPEETNKSEEYWIQFFQSRNRHIGYNIMAGGTNREIAEETREKLRIASSGENNAFYGKTHTPESRARMSASHMGSVASEESRRKMSEQRKGEKNVMYGKTHTPEARAAMSAALTGIPLKPETKQKLSILNSGEGNPFYGKTHTQETKDLISAARMGTTHSPETKQKMSDQRRGEKNAMYGKTHTPEARKKIADARREGIKYRKRDEKGRLVKEAK